MRGFGPRRVHGDSWEARCLAQRSLDRALSITRNGFNQVVLESRGSHKCQHRRIVGALGFMNDRVYAKAPEWLVSRLSRVQIRPATFERSVEMGRSSLGASADERSVPVAEASPAAQDYASTARSSFGVRTGMGEPGKSLGFGVTIASSPAWTAHAI
jgi:hypothetical protein